MTRSEFQNLLQLEIQAFLALHYSDDPAAFAGDGLQGYVRHPLQEKAVEDITLYGLT
jgi:hypothetical protein